jgi:putative Mn2+ efflux pump MntP
MNFHGNSFFSVMSIIFGFISLILYLGFFILIVLGIIFLYKKIQNEAKIDCIEKELKSIKTILENMKESKGDLNEK